MSEPEVRNTAVEQQTSAVEQPNVVVQKDKNSGEPEMLTSSDEIKGYIRSLRRENKAYREKLRELQLEAEKLKSIEAKHKELTTKYQTLESSIREKLLQKIPENKREKYKDWEIEKLQVFVEDLEEIEKSRSQSPGQMTGRPLYELDVSSMSQEDWNNLRITNFELYKQKMQEVITKKNKGG